MKKFFGFLMIFVTTLVYAGGSDTVRILNASTMIVTGVTNRGFTLGSDTPAGDATAETAPAKIYVPIVRSISGFDNQPYFSLYRTEGITSLFDISSTAHYIAFPLLITNGATANNIYAAVKSGTSYYVIARYSASISGATNETIYFNISPKAICDQIISAGGVECNSLGITSNVEVSPAPKILLYFFQTPATTSITVPGTTIDPAAAAYNGGIYFEVQMSNRVYDTSELTVFISQVKAGDGRIILTVTSSADMLDFKNMLIFNHGDAGPSAGAYLPIGNYIGGSLIDLNIGNQSGEITVNKLSDGSSVQNNKDYWFSPVLVDKFKFATTLPTPEVGRAQEIEQLLKKQACFLLTAGFGQEHYVITYFRNFRDQVLLKNSLGQKFVSFYYRTAPKYALMIYKSEVIRLVIRGVAYFLYFIFNNIKLLSISFALIINIIIFKRVKKWHR